MEEIVTILSTGEWAIAIWGTGFFVWMLTQSEIRKSLWNVIKILLGKKLRHFFNCFICGGNNHDILSVTILE